MFEIVFLLQSKSPATKSQEEKKAAKRGGKERYVHMFVLIIMIKELSFYSPDGIVV